MSSVPPAKVHEAAFRLPSVAEKPLLTAPEMAAALRISERSVREHQSELPGFLRIGASVRFSNAKVHEFLGLTAESGAA